MKELLSKLIDNEKTAVCSISDKIHDNPEYDGEEYLAAELLENYLEQNCFSVEKGLKNWPTAFRAVYKKGTGYPRIGLLVEYDALKVLGHGCGHHMQGPSLCAAAVALKNADINKDYSIIVYGTPAEETYGAKIDMCNNGYFRDIDVALMIHAGDTTCTDESSLALSEYNVTFHGKSAHAAIAPWLGRSALDAVLLAFHGVECLREHVNEDTRIHYTITETPGPANVVPETAKANFMLRSKSRNRLNDICTRFEKIIEGASLMTECTYEFERLGDYDNKLACDGLDEIIIKNAENLNAPCIRKPRKATGSTDFGNVTQLVPGSCLRIAFVPEGTVSHSIEFVENGKSENAHKAITISAKVIADTCYEIIEKPELIEQFKKENEQKKLSI